SCPRAVVDLVVGVERAGDVLGADVGGQVVGLRQRVVAGVGAVEDERGDRDRLVVADRRRGELGLVAGALLEADGVAGLDPDEVGGAVGDVGRLAGVVDLVVGGRVGQRQLLGADVGGQVVGLRQRVVAGVGAVEDEPGDRDRLVV